MITLSKMRCEKCGQTDPSEAQSQSNDWVCPNCRMEPQIPRPSEVQVQEMGVVSITILPPPVPTTQTETRVDALELQKKEKDNPENIEVFLHCGSCMEKNGFAIHPKILQGVWKKENQFKWNCSKCKTQNEYTSSSEDGEKLENKTETTKEDVVIFFDCPNCSEHSSKVTLKEFEDLCLAGKDMQWKCHGCKQYNAFHWKTYISTHLITEKRTEARTSPPPPRRTEEAKAIPQETGTTWDDVTVPSFCFCVSYFMDKANSAKGETEGVVVLASCCAMPMALVGDLVSPFVAAVLFPFLCVFLASKFPLMKVWGMSLAVPRTTFCSLGGLIFIAILIPLVIIFAPCIARRSGNALESPNGDGDCNCAGDGDCEGGD
jgi:hypothetical protein